MSFSAPRKNHKPRPAGELLKNSSMFYLVLGAVGALVCYYSHHNLSAILRAPASSDELFRWIILSSLGAGVLLIQSYLFEEFFPSFKSLRGLLTRFMGAVPTPVLLYLALLSAVAEEILFRGAIQPSLGLIGASLLFGLLHLGPTGGLSSWSLWAVLAGLLLGWMFQHTQSLWPVIFTHALVNVLSMLRMRRDYRSLIEQAKAKSRQQNSQEEMGPSESNDPISR